MSTAQKTLDKIEEMMLADQGAAFRVLQGELMPTAEDAYRGEDPPFRTHLGASLIGRECGREIWYGFRWVTLPSFSGRMLRLFNRGHLEEPRMTALLRMIGCKVWTHDDKGKQYRIAKGHKGHAGGGLDGVAMGVPDMPGVPLLAEFKTHGEKSFLKLQEEGIVKAKWEHYVQMQIYMDDKKLIGGLYMATNKNTDELHAEIVMADKLQADRFKQRTIMIIDATEAPPRIGKDETFFKCRFCDHKEVCHLGADPHKTCRSCENVVILDGGRWGCSLLQTVLTADEQRAACSRYGVSSGVHSIP